MRTEFRGAYYRRALPCTPANVRGHGLFLVIGLLLAAAAVLAQEPDSAPDRRIARRATGAGSDAATDRLLTSLDYQEIRLLNEKKSSLPQSIKGRKAADVEDLSLPDKAVDEIGRARRSLKENKPQAAIEHLKKAASIYPQYSKVHNNLGLIYREMGRLPEAEAAFLKAVEINPRNQIAQRNLGYLYIAMNRPERAVGPLSEAERLEPADAGAKAFLGDAMFRLGHMDEAEASLRTALLIKPDFYPAAYRLGCLYAQQRRFPEAIALLERVLKSDHPGLETASVEKLISKLRELPR